jgi:hypothetical protein
MVDLLLSREDMPSGWEVLERSDGYFGDQGQIDGAYVIFFTSNPVTLSGQKKIFSGMTAAVRQAGIMTGSSEFISMKIKPH